MRLYIRGIIDGLAGQTFQIGDNNDYVIDYRERSEADLNDATNFVPTVDFPTSYLILGMSTTVVWAASNFNNTVPIVGIVSDPKGVGIDASNICGISGQRSQFGDKYYDRFLDTVPVLKDPTLKVYLLHKQGYAPTMN